MAVWSWLQHGGPPDADGPAIRSVLEGLHRLIAVELRTLPEAPDPDAARERLDWGRALDE